MSELIIPKQHLALTGSNILMEICSDLFEKFGVAYFNYSRFNNDFSHTSLTSDADWAHFFYTEDYKNKFLYDNKLLEITHDCTFLLWVSFPENKLIQNLRQHYGYDHGIVLIENHDDYIDYYSFAGYKDNPQIMNFFINNLDILMKFCLYFKEKAHDIVDTANDDKIILPESIMGTNLKSGSKGISYTEDKINAYKEAIKINRYYVSSIPDKNSYLTSREFECTSRYALGYSSKEIGLILGLSSRTVETHVKAAKLKLGCHGRKQLRPHFKNMLENLCD